MSYSATIDILNKCYIEGEQSLNTGDYSGTGLTAYSSIIDIMNAIFDGTNKIGVIEV